LSITNTSSLNFISQTVITPWALEDCMRVMAPSEREEWRKHYAERDLKEADPKGRPIQRGLAVFC